MENASKALIMAGGVLLAIMILSLLVSVGISMSDMVGAQDEKTATQQVQQFNESYLAYNKSKMYGIDVITVVNKAIDYNTKLGTDDEEYKINIILKLNQNFDRTKQVITQYGNGKIDYGTTTTVQEGTLKLGTYQLFEREGSIKMNNEVIEFFHQGSDDKTTNIQGTTIVTTYEYSAITNFKTAIFACTEVGYSEITGKVNLMVFEQQ